MNSLATLFEISTRVAFGGQNPIEIAGQKLMPDSSKAYVEFHLAHAFPVVTTDHTALHPQVVANSYQSMLHQVFNLSHIMRAYNPEEHARDRILGSVVGVEFNADGVRRDNFGSRGNFGKLTVQPDRARAPGIRGVAVLHKNAQGADRILGQHQSGRHKWTVSMENEYAPAESGFLIEDGAADKSLADWAAQTPRDFQDLNYTYVPFMGAPEELAESFDAEKSRVKKPYRRKNTVALLGGLDGAVHFKGVGLTPLGKEPEAEIAQMLASGASFADVDDVLLAQLLGPLRATLAAGLRK